MFSSFKKVLLATSTTSTALDMNLPLAETITSDWPDGEHSVEALGPKIQSNPLGLANHICVPFNLKPTIYEGVPRDYEFLRGFLSDLDSKFSPGHLAEGIVFHHPDGRRAKIKRKDFPRK